jgi:hypothetical protein
MAQKGSAFHRTYSVAELDYGELGDALGRQEHD